ncbi:threonine ammonia-lyase [Nibricoccus aquaticus]|uniref:threonine ammonia-lyase n=1 Tax=Nibricoccus aquaticus TaxID=2576891 RepID=UPI001FEAFC1A|nr:threonine ammonia-lyase [Nibricoccus aquaticus]
MLLDDIQAAALRIENSVLLTPCTESHALSEITGSRIFCKLDNLQHTGSFKERGACNALMQLPAPARRLGVIAASAGNHALGLSYHARRLGIPATVVMPVQAPLIKITRCERLGARVILHGSDFSEARAHAQTLAQQEALSYIHGFDDPQIIAGQGTIGLEVLAQVPHLDAMIIPIGGGGLIAGAAIAIKSLNPKIKIIGVESSQAAAFSAALSAGHPVPLPKLPTLADGLAVFEVGSTAFTLARPHIDQVVTVDENTIALAILRHIELEKTVVEGAAATPLAALISGQLPELKGKTVALAIGGGNIDPLILSSVVEKSLVTDGRLIRFVVGISDRPGGLARLTRTIADAGASIKDIAHDRTFNGPDTSAVRVTCTVETRNRSHIAEMNQALQRAGFTVSPA